MSTPTTKRGAFIVFEGIDRVGKSTQCKRLAEFLNAEGHKTELMVFPDRSTDFGKTIDAYLQNKANLNDRMIHLLFSLNRHEASRKILETLESGTSIVCDRYAYSGAAYTMAKSTKEQEFDYEWCIMPDVGLPQPDVICFLDMAVAESMKRADFGGERYEKKDFQERIRGNFHYIRTRTEGHGPQWKEFDATKAMDDITAEIKSQMKPLVEKVMGTEVSFLTRGSVLPSENAPTPPAEKASEASAMDVDEAEKPKDLQAMCSALEQVANFMESEKNTPSDEKWLADLKSWAATVTNRVKAKSTIKTPSDEKWLADLKSWAATVTDRVKAKNGQSTIKTPSDDKWLADLKRWAETVSKKSRDKKSVNGGMGEKDEPEASSKPAITEAPEGMDTDAAEKTEEQKAEEKTEEEAPEETKPATEEKAPGTKPAAEKAEEKSDACAAAAVAAGVPAENTTAPAKEKEGEKKATPAKRPLADADSGHVEKKAKIAT